MADQIYIAKFNATLEKVKTSDQEWEDALTSIEGLKFIDDPKQSYKSVEIFNTSINDWHPLFWIDQEGIGFCRVNSLLAYDEGYEKAIELAEKINGLLYDDYEEVYYLPGYGVLIDNIGPEDQAILTIDDIIKNDLLNSTDVRKNLDEFLSNKISEEAPAIQKQKTIEISKKWWEFWK